MTSLMTEETIVRTVMEDQSQAPKPNPNPNPRTNTPKRRTMNSVKKKSEFELCKVCNLNHDQGQRHKYFPNHTKSLSAFLSRFQSKMSDVRFFIKNPSFLRPENASRNRLWCVFCDCDVDERGSSFVCNNAINHLASDDHLKNLKHFLWKYGGGMDHVDNFRISEADVAKWEKKCKSLESEAAASSEGAHGPLSGPSNDIHNELNYGNIDNFGKTNIYPLESNLSNSVMPLQYYTNEYQVSHSGLSGVANGLFQHDATSSFHLEAHSGANLWNSNDLTVNRNIQPNLHNNGQWSASGYLGNGAIYQVYQDERMVTGLSSSQGLQNLTQISSRAHEEARGNVHSGAPPPWFEGTEENRFNVQLKPVLGSLVSSLTKSGTSHKLNPKRVGAAWAERRKIELEREKRGEFIKSDCDANWLPNFGRVWQSGSRKESRKEFEMEKQKILEVESQSEMPIQIQPYISKRMVSSTLPCTELLEVSNSFKLLAYKRRDVNSQASK